MYTVHFLQGETSLDKGVCQIIEQTVARVCEDVRTDISLEACEVLVTVNPKKVFEGDMFLGLSYDDTAIYLFADAAAAHHAAPTDAGAVAAQVAEHCYRSLYTTARTRHIGLGPDCGLLEEVVNEGLSEIFVTERMSAEPKQRFVQFSDAEIKRLWGKMKGEFDDAVPSVEKWFWGSEEDAVPPLTACSVGYAIAAAYLASRKKKSSQALTTPARDIAVLQDRY